MAGGYLPWPGVPTLAKRLSTLAGGGGYAILARGTPPWQGVPTLARGVHMGYPPGVNRQMAVKTVPSPILRMRAVTTEFGTEATIIALKSLTNFG